MSLNETHLVLVNVDVVQLVLIRAARASTLLRLFELNDDADKLDEAGALLREEIDDNRSMKNMNRFWKLLALLAVIVLIFVAAPSLAQEVTPAATPVVTPVPVELEPVAGIRASDIWPFVAIIALLIFGVFEAWHKHDINRLFDRYDEALKRKDTRDYGERKFTESALSVQDTVLMVQGIVKVLAGLNIPIVDQPLESTKQYLDDITDGKPNLPPIDSAGRSYEPVEPGNAGPLTEGLGSRRDYTQPAGTTFGDVKPGEPVG